MSAQREAYISCLGDNWYHRNKSDLGNKLDDPVERLFAAFKEGSVKRVLEIGCANGWRLKKLKAKGFEVYGIDPSADAILDARASIESPDTEGDDSNFCIGTANFIPWVNGYFDCVIMGFCMWAMSPEDWFPAVAESDRVLRDGGALIIHDRFSSRPIRREYPESGMDGMYQFSYDWKNLWLAHPAYVEAAEALGVWPGTTSVEGAVLLQKNIYGRMLTSVSNTEEIK